MAIWGNACTPLWAMVLEDLPFRQFCHGTNFTPKYFNYINKLLLQKSDLTAMLTFTSHGIGD